jgi:hypothetical protein
VDVKKEKKTSKISIVPDVKKTRVNLIFLHPKPG